MKRLCVMAFASGVTAAAAAFNVVWFVPIGKIFQFITAAAIVGSVFLLFVAVKKLFRPWKTWSD